MNPRLLLLLFLVLPSCVNAGSPVVYHHELRHNPNLSIYSLIIDLADPRVAVRVAPAGDDPDGPGPWLTTLLSVPEIANRDGYDIAINGDFFKAADTKDIEGKNTGYIRGKWAAPVGWAVTDGQLWAKSPTTRAAFVIDSHSHAAIANIDPKKPFPAGVQQAIGAGVTLLKAGLPVPQTNTARHPRTALGLDKSGAKLILLVVDGRQPALSIGMSYAELATEMLNLGAYSAINLDGGGSSTLVLRNRTTGKLHIVNHPSDGKPRAVADILGITLRGGLASTQPSPN